MKYEKTSKSWGPFNIMTKTGRPEKVIQPWIDRLRSCSGPVFRVYPYKWLHAATRRRRLVGESDHLNVMRVVQYYGLRYAEGNDAPRGGKEGFFVEIKVDRRNRLFRQK